MCVCVCVYIITCVCVCVCVCDHTLRFASCAHGQHNNHVILFITLTKLQPCNNQTALHLGTSLWWIFKNTLCTSCKATDIHSESYSRSFRVNNLIPVKLQTFIQKATVVHSECHMQRAENSAIYIGCHCGTESA